MNANAAAMAARTHRTVAELYTEYAETCRDDGLTALAAMYSEASNLHADVASKWERFSADLRVQEAAKPADTWKLRGRLHILEKGIGVLEAQLLEVEEQIEQENERLFPPTTDREDFHSDG